MISQKTRTFFVLIFIIIIITENISKLGRVTLRCVSLVTDRKIRVNEYYRFFIKQLEIDLYLSRKKIIETRQYLKILQFFSWNFLNHLEQIQLQHYHHKRTTHKMHTLVNVIKIIHE